MFYKTKTGRLQNLLLLQDVMICEIKNDEEIKYNIGYVQVNGLVINEGEFDSYDEANTVLQEIITDLTTK